MSPLTVKSKAAFKILKQRGHLPCRFHHYASCINNFFLLKIRNVGKQKLFSLHFIRV